MEFSHVPVLYDECMENLNIKPDGVYVDGTLGGGGHASGVCSRLGPEGLFIGIDRDADAQAAAGKRLEQYNCRKIFVHDNYTNIKNILKDLGIDHIDGALLDLGVSSFQLDEGSRGFSYMHPAPLDMRMDQSSAFTARDVVNGYSEAELTNIIRKYGEEKWAKRISHFIVEARKNGPVETTDELVDIIKRAIPASARRDGPHPAKRTFQAIRIEVNDELGGLETAVGDFIDALGAGGRLCIITFHSLEDRIVKERFAERENPCTCPKNMPCVCGRKPVIKRISRKPIIPGEEEIENNPRSRSAKLRVAEKLKMVTVK
ncbi:MAG: 16S rRNA (cytosine(1402)-N(4))-methyltransferase RsmH [Clostridia bacterium]|nr:16S rRNA (cytosine(1402)-N(4))-methyltransferase RsmH [Clostridia bacterium]